MGSLSGVGRLLHGLAGLEHRILRSGNDDSLFRLGVAPHPLSPGLHRQAAEAHDRDSLSLAHSIHGGRQRRLNDFSNQSLGLATFVGNLSNEFTFVHVESLLSVLVFQCLFDWLNDIIPFYFILVN